MKENGGDEHHEKREVQVVPEPKRSFGGFHQRDALLETRLDGESLDAFHLERRAFPW
jgi:hypothetical protein